MMNMNTVYKVQERTQMVDYNKLRQNIKEIPGM